MAAVRAPPAGTVTAGGAAATVEEETSMTDPDTSGLFFNVFKMSEHWALNLSRFFLYSFLIAMVVPGTFQAF